MSVTKLAVRHKGQSMQSTYRECSSIQRKKKPEQKKIILNPALHHEKDLFISFMTEKNCKLQYSHCQDRLNLRHIGIQCHFSHFTYPKTLKDDNKLLHICLFVQTDYRQLKKRTGQIEERESQETMTRLHLNSCSVFFRRKHMDIQVQDTSGFNQAFLWKSAIRGTVNICNCVSGCLLKNWGVNFFLGYNIW